MDGGRAHDCSWFRGRSNVYYHVPIQTILMVLPFRLLWGWGGVWAHDCSWFRVLECFLSCANPDNTDGSTFSAFAGVGGLGLTTVDGSGF